jgi:hypothetical protein
MMPCRAAAALMRGARSSDVVSTVFDFAAAFSRNIEVAQRGRAGTSTSQRIADCRDGRTRRISSCDPRTSRDRKIRHRASESVQVDAHRNKLVHTWQPGGNRHPLDRLAAWIAKWQLGIRSVA